MMNLAMRIPATKPMVNFYWRSMPFRLKLKGYQGNCVTCWKKSDRKLFQIAKENPKAFEWNYEMERKYGMVNGEKSVFFRNQRGTEQILEQAKNFKGKVADDSDFYSWQLDLIGGDSCEVFSECGV